MGISNKLTNEQRDDLRARLLKGESVEDLAKEFDLHPSTVNYHKQRAKGVRYPSSLVHRPKPRKKLNEMTEIGKHRVETQKLLDENWPEIQRRISKGERITALAREFKVHTTSIYKRRWGLSPTNPANKGKKPVRNFPIAVQHKRSTETEAEFIDIPMNQAPQSKKMAVIILDQSNINSILGELCK